MGYASKAIKGVGWTGFLQVALKSVSLIKFIVIARFLTPSEFGVFGIAILTIGFFQALTETGISSFIVQSDEKEEEYISSAWIVSISRGIFLFLVTIIAAYPISIFFGSKESFFVILIASLIPLFNGFENPSVAKFQKYLDFHKEFFFRLLVSIFDFIISIFFIFHFKNSIGLIYALVLASLFETVISFVLINPKPRLIKDMQKIKKIFHFGKWITAISSMNYFVEQLDSIIVGRLLGLESLGLYEMAQKFSLQILSDGGYVFSKVTFPLFSRIKSDSKRTKRALIKILLAVFIIFGSISLVLFVFSKEIILTFAGIKWISADIPLKIFSLSGFITALMAVVTSLFLSHAKQDITAKLLGVRFIILLILIVPASLNYGIIGASAVSLLSYILVLPIAIYGLKKIVPFRK